MRRTASYELPNRKRARDSLPNKFDAMAKHGIKIVERVPIPPELIPADAAVEMEAKKAAGYFVPDPDQVADAEELKNIQGRKLDE